MCYNYSLFILMRVLHFMVHHGYCCFMVWCICDAQELQLALEKARFALQEREEQLREAERERQREREERERTIRELKTSLQTKEQLLEVRHDQ